MIYFFLNYYYKMFLVQAIYNVDSTSIDIDIQIIEF